MAICTQWLMKKCQRGEFILHPLAEMCLNKLLKEVQVINAFIKNTIQGQLTKLKRKKLHSSDNRLPEKISMSYCHCTYFRILLYLLESQAYMTTASDTHWYTLGFVCIFLAFQKHILELSWLLSLEQWCVLCDYEILSLSGSTDVLKLNKLASLFSHFASEISTYVLEIS